MKSEPRFGWNRGLHWVQHIFYARFFVFHVLGQGCDMLSLLKLKFSVSANLNEVAGSILHRHASALS